MQVTIYADVIDVDKAHQTIRVRGRPYPDPQGAGSGPVRPHRQGDQIKAVQTTAIAIGIAPRVPEPRPRQACPSLPGPGWGQPLPLTPKDCRLNHIMPGRRICR